MIQVKVIELNVLVGRRHNMSWRSISPRGSTVHGGDARNDGRPLQGEVVFDPVEGC